MPLPFVLAILTIVASGCSTSSPGSVWAEARTAFESHQYDRAEAAMARLARLRDAKPEDHLMRAQLAMVHDRTDEALDELARVPDGHPLAPQARTQAGQLELRRDRARVAEGHFLDAIRLQPDMAKAHSELIFIYGFELRRPELAEHFRALSEIEPLRFDQVFLWCLTRGVVWEPGEAAAKLARFVEADPGDRWARLALADMLLRLNRYDDVATTLAPLPDDDPEARALRARLALDRGDEKAAESLLAGGPRVHLGLDLLRGRLAIARGDDKAAVAAFRDALAAEPNNRDALFGLAHALQATGDPEAGRYLALSARHERFGTLIQRAASPRAPDDLDLIRELGAACAAIGRIPEARAWYSLLIRRNPLDSEAQQALYRLKSP